MPNPLATLVEKHAGSMALPRLKQFVVGLAEDFWKDGAWPPQKNIPPTSVQPTPAPSHTKPAPKPAREWHAAPGEISEKMWGDGAVTPGGEAIFDMLIMPLGLNKDTSVLDLSAGLGGRMRKTVEEFQVYVTGLEPDPEIAARGMELSIKAGKGKHAAITTYDPAHLSLTHKYDCVIARETFYRLPDKAAFFKIIAEATKPGAQISFTDYIVDPENREKPGIVAWQKTEANAAPLGLVEMAEAWAKLGFNLRVHDDQTEFYRKQVLQGLKRFALFMASDANPDSVTKKTIARRLNNWHHRMTALSQGMKFYRFYGTKRDS